MDNARMRKSGGRWIRIECSYVSALIGEKVEILGKLAVIFCPRRTIGEIRKQASRTILTNTIIIAPDIWLICKVSAGQMSGVRRYLQP